MTTIQAHPGVGDQGQQYEVTYWSTGKGERKVFGWAETPEGVTAMFNSIKLNPGMGHPKMRDREKFPDPAPPAASLKPEGKKRSYDEPGAD